MAHQKILNHIALCVCTRNRPNYIRDFLLHLKDIDSLPRICVIIDSSDSSVTEDIVKTFSPNSPIEIRWISSLPGLPHQRNVGIDFLKSLSFVNQIKISSFLDDDIKVRPDYFEVVSQLFNEYQAAISIGGYCAGEAKVNNKSLVRRLTLIGSRKTGVILKSGFAIPPLPTIDVMETQWIQGGSQNIRFEMFESEVFNGRIRMYGEDVEFYSRISKYGKILCSKQLAVKHLEAAEDKDNLRSVQGYSDGFRWTLALNKRSGVRKSAVLLSTSYLIIAELFIWCASFQERHKQILLGHLDFVVRVIRRAQVQQFVDHAGSGPTPSPPINYHLSQP